MVQDNPVHGAVIPINQNGVGPGPRKLEQFRLACKLAKLPDTAKANPTNASSPLARLKLFDPCGDSTWLITDWNSEDETAFGWCYLGDPQCAELGSVSLEELAYHKGPMGIGIEIDNWFKPTPLCDIKEYGLPQPWMQPPIIESTPVAVTQETQPQPTNSMSENIHLERFKSEIGPKLREYINAPEYQRLQIWIKQKTSGAGLNHFLVSDAPDADKKKLLDEVDRIVTNRAWSELPAAPSGQAEVANPQTPTPVSAAPAFAAPKPKPAPVTPPPAPTPVTKALPTPDEDEDPIAMILAGMQKLKTQQQPVAQQGLTEEDVARIAKEAIREELKVLFHGLLKSLS